MGAEDCNETDGFSECALESECDSLGFFTVGGSVEWEKLNVNAFWAIFTTFYITNLTFSRMFTVYK